VALYLMSYNFARVYQTPRGTRWRLDSLTVSGPPKKSSPASGEPESLLLRVKRLRQEAEEFHRTVGEELRTTRALLEDLSVRQAKKRGHGR
jgi:hypothetical protein